ncbi:nucleoside diphosphate kinase [Podospora didyma]|uniref:Nucleoside diphosphate kinase n=1 Tax=Podospora didyma TaxID=330526 RepID=A0AAE0KLK5_9PEZI|nr:nucleoside diphosphate kinase [Podospora didyma]
MATASSTARPDKINPAFDVWKRKSGPQEPPGLQKRQSSQRETSTQARKWAPLIFLVGAVCGILLTLLFCSHPTYSRQLSSPNDPPLLQTSSPPTLHERPATPQLSVKPENPDKMSTTEQTFIAIKPDGVQRGLVGPIISRFETRGFKLVAIKLVTPGKEHLEAHYADLKEKSFFPGLISYMNSGPICAMIWEGLDAVKTGRTILGATNPLASAPGTIRGDYALQTGRNICHGSDSVENAKKEIALWFKEGEQVSWKSALESWTYE